MSAAYWIAYTSAGVLMMLVAGVGLLVLRRLRRRRLLAIPRLMRGDTEWKG